MLLPIYSVILVIVSVITYALYAGDKKKAKKGKWRTPEATLLGFSFFGGAIGGTFAMFHLRHKTKHWYFKAVNFLGLAWQFALLIYLIINS